MTTNPAVALALLRVLTGLIFAAHGVQKIFISGLEQVTQQFRQWDVPSPLLTAPLVASFEIIGGALLVLGLAARPISFIFSLIMTGAIALAHWDRDFFGLNGMEFPLLLLGTSLAIVIGGPGQPSADLDRIRASASPKAQ